MDLLEVEPVAFNFYYSEVYAQWLIDVNGQEVVHTGRAGQFLQRKAQ